MGAWLMAGLAGTFATLVFAACAARGRNARTRAIRWTWLTLGAGPLLLASALLCGFACWIRFGIGARSSPWAPAIALFLLHALAVAWTWKRVMSAGSPSNVRALPLAFGALVALALAMATLSNLELRGRLVAAELGIEAGKLAYSVRGPRVDDAQNAAPLYERHLDVIEKDEQYDLDAWSKIGGGEAEPPEKPFDPSDAELRARLARWAPILDDARRAAQLPHCRLEEPKDAYSPPVRSAIPLLDIARALTLEARLRAAGGDAHGAFEDVAAGFALARHVSETPAAITLMLSTVMNDLATHALVNVLDSRAVELDDLRVIEPWTATSLAAGLPRMIAAEEAYTLGVLGEAFSGARDARMTFVGSAGQHELYLALMFEEEMRTFRELMAEFRSTALLSAEELRRHAQTSEADYVARFRAAGLVPIFFGWGNVERLLVVHEADARLVLARLALAAKRHQLERGRFPTTMSELGGAPANVTLEGDGSYVLLRDTRSAFEKPVEVRLPPEDRRARLRNTGYAGEEGDAMPPVGGKK